MSIAEKHESVDANCGAPHVEACIERLTQTLNEGGLALMISIGHRTGLFDTMADLEPAGSHRIAERAGLRERYVREWLGAMVTGKVVTYDPADGTYYLPASYAAALTRAATPANLASTMQWIGVLGSVEDQVVEAFERGGGVPYAAFKRFHDVMADESDQTVVAGLIEYILPLVPDLAEKLERGIRVLDIGCGSGRAMIRLAEMYPASYFRGYDLCHDAVTAARRLARESRLYNVEFDVADLAQMRETVTYDLITAFDVIHDQADPATVLSNVRNALRPGGVFLMQDIASSSHLHENHDHPLGPFLYTISCMHCMTVSLAQGGAGLGTCWGRERAQEMLRDAGFRNVSLHQLPHDSLNDYYIARESPEKK